MSPRLLLVILPAGLAALVGVGCESASSSTSPDVETPIHPQPQPNAGEVRFTSPCTPGTCGSAPSSLESPHCKSQPGTAPTPASCGWSDADGTVSYRPCADAECGVAPGADLCPPSTIFRGNTCGSENEAACAWSTVCAPPPSTTPCSDPEGCGAQPAIGVICSDGGSGGLACMQVSSGCAWQRTCD